MKLYHGSNQRISQIDFAKCHPFKDFGCGFYLTDNLEHARNMAFRRVMRTGGKECVTEFEFNLKTATQALKIKIFEKPSEDWANFVMMNRSREIQHPAHDYDIVIGPIANDSVVVSFRLFQDGYISMPELIKRLEYKELSIQYFFHTTAAINHLKRIV